MHPEPSIFLRVTPLWCRLLVVLPLLLSCSPSTTAAFGSWQPTLLATPEIATLERQMAERLNRDRAQEGLPALTYDERLADIARAHSLDMRDAGFFAHESPTTGLLEDRLDRAGYLALEGRENLAVAGTLDRAEDNLLNSPGHRANIMATTVSHIGIGVVRGDSSGNPDALTITQVFSSPTALEGADEVARRVTAALDAARREHGKAPLAAHEMLQSLAQRHVADLPDGLPEGAVGEVGDQVSAALNQQQGHGLVSIRIVAQSVFNASEFEIPAAALEAPTQHIGLATRAAKDERGRPRVAILALLGRVAR